MQTIQKQPFGHWLLIAVADRARRLRAVAVRAGLRRPRPRGRRRPLHVRAHRCGGERLRVRRDVRAGRLDPAGRVEPELEQPAQVGRGRARVAGRPVDRRRGRRRSSSASRCTRATRASPGSSSRRTRPRRWARPRSGGSPGIGVVGHLARMVAFGLIGVFVVKAAVDYAPEKAVGLDGALSRLAHQTLRPVPARRRRRRADRVRPLLDRRRPLPPDLTQKSVLAAGAASTSG